MKVIVFIVYNVKIHLVVVVQLVVVQRLYAIFVGVVGAIKRTHHVVGLLGARDAGLFIVDIGNTGEVIFIGVVVPDDGL